MSAPDDKPEGLTSTSGALAEMKRYSVRGMDLHEPCDACDEYHCEAVVKSADADRVIATERRENSEAIAARDARIAWLVYCNTSHMDHMRAKDEAIAEFRAAARDSIATLYQVASALCATVPDPEFPPRMNREARHKIARENDIADGQCKGFAIVLGNTAKRLSALITPPSQAPEARRDVGGEKL